MSIQFELLKATSGLTDPFAILGSDNSANTSLGSSIWAPQLTYVIKAVGIIGAVVGIMCAIIISMVVGDPRSTREQKKEITHKLAVVAVISALPWICDIVLSIANQTFF